MRNSSKQGDKMKYKTDIRSKQTLSVRSGCRAGVGMLGQKAICTQRCITEDKGQRHICAELGWQKNEMCDLSRVRSRMDSCLAACK